jgi:hypothetical protein
MSLSTPTSQYLLLFRHRADVPDLSDAEMAAVIGKVTAWLRELQARGQFVSTSPLSDDGRVLRGAGGATVTDGAFVEAKEVVGGYVIINAPNLDIATNIARGMPHLDRTTIEVREMRRLPGF